MRHLIGVVGGLALLVGSVPLPFVGSGSQAAAETGNTVYLPNITRMLGGPTGWQTPFIVQNIGTVSTDLDVAFYGFADGALVTRRQVIGLKPGTSFADVPNNDTDLPAGQFSVVIRSSAAAVVSVVNEHQGVGARAEALSYSGVSAGATKVFLPYVSKNFDGWLTTFIIQNLGGAPTTANISLMPTPGVDSSGQPFPVFGLTRTIEPGRSQFVDPRVERSLPSIPFAATITADQPIAVVVNAHNDSADVVAPRAYSYNGIANVGNGTYVAYAARLGDGVGRSTRLHVQNAGPVAAKPEGNIYKNGQIRPVSILTANRAALPGEDVIFDLGSDTAAFLGSGDFSVIVTGGQFAVLNQTTSPSTGLGFVGTSAPSSKLYLPNVTRTLGGTTGWTTPFYLQSATATSATVKWFRFSDGSLAYTQSLSSLSSGQSVKIDPRTLPLTDDSQYAVVVEAASGTVTAVVLEYAEGGDNAMAYEAFAGN